MPYKLYTALQPARQLHAWLTRIIACIADLLPCIVLSTDKAKYSISAGTAMTSRSKLKWVINKNLTADITR